MKCLMLCLTCSWRAESVTADVNNSAKLYGNCSFARHCNDLMYGINTEHDFCCSDPSANSFSVDAELDLAVVLQGTAGHSLLQ